MPTLGYDRERTVASPFLRSERLNTLFRLIRTIRYLRPVQVANRISRRLRRPGTARAEPLTCRGPVASWIEAAPRKPVLLGPDRIDLIGISADISSPEIWRDSRKPKLWLYQLHYFDDMNGVGREHRTTWQRALMDRWMQENPPGSAVAWDPYPISLRVVNWIKWQLSGGGTLGDGDLASLCQQVRHLLPRLEYHLLGNHLLENFKALVFAGCFFQGEEAEGWLAMGMKGLHEQLAEQILPVGAHNELAPMYQAIITEGVLDTINVLRCHGFAPAQWLTDAAMRMVGWNVSVAHPDGEWPQFNDTALGAAPRPGELAAYLLRLALEPRTPDDPSSNPFPRIEWDHWTLIADVGGLGPDHNPGHGHADNLTFELSLFGRRLVVDTGVSTYDVNPVRARERGTAAHNTLEIDGEDSSEVWGSFRVGRRARTRCIQNSEGVIEAEHDGYRHLPGSPIHRRAWRCGPERLIVVDEIRSSASHSIRSFIHLHPHYNAAPATDGSCIVREGDKAIARVVPESWAHTRVIDRQYAPRFGCLVDAQCIEFTASSSPGVSRFGFTIEGI